MEYVWTATNSPVDKNGLTELGISDLLELEFIKPVPVHGQNTVTAQDAMLYGLGVAPEVWRYGGGGHAQTTDSAYDFGVYDDEKGGIVFYQNGVATHSLNLDTMICNEIAIGFGTPEPEQKPQKPSLPAGATLHKAINANCLQLPDSKCFMMGK